MSLSCGTRPNLLIAGLPATVLQRLRPQLETVALPQGQALYEPGGEMSYAYFPTSAVVSRELQTADGALMQLAVVGNEGMVGVELFLGGAAKPSCAVVQSAGELLRLPARTIQDEFERAGSAMHLLLRYTQALITQVAQTVVCARHHSLEQRLCRLLLMSLDRIQGDEILETQERIANMLGVRREGVTGAALHLQTLGLIRYGRGHIRVLDRSRLEKQACECYAVVKKEYGRLLHETLQAANLASVSEAATDQPDSPTHLPGNAPAPVAMAYPSALQRTS